MGKKISLMRSSLLFVGLIAVIFLQDKGASARNILNRPGSGNRIRQEKLFHGDPESDHNDFDGGFSMDNDSEDFDIPAGFGHPHLGLGLDSWGGLRSYPEEDLGVPDAQMSRHLKRKRVKRLTFGERKDRAKPKPGCCYCGDHLCCDTMCHGK